MKTSSLSFLILLCINISFTSAFAETISNKSNNKLLEYHQPQTEAEKTLELIVACSDYIFGEKLFMQDIDIAKRHVKDISPKLYNLLKKANNIKIFHSIVRKFLLTKDLNDAENECLKQKCKGKEFDQCGSQCVRHHSFNHFTGDFYFYHTVKENEKVSYIYMVNSDYWRSVNDVSIDTNPPISEKHSSPHFQYKLIKKDGLWKLDGYAGDDGEVSINYQFQNHSN